VPYVFQAGFFIDVIFIAGTVDKGTVEVSNCFCVPHREYDTEVNF
jgi:hypothetical protein